MGKKNCGYMISFGLVKSPFVKAIWVQDLAKTKGSALSPWLVTLSPPTSEARVRSPAWLQVGKLVVACRWSAIYSTEP